MKRTKRNLGIFGIMHRLSGIDDSPIFLASIPLRGRSRFFRRFKGRHIATWSVVRFWRLRIGGFHLSHGVAVVVIQFVQTFGRPARG